MGLYGLFCLSAIRTRAVLSALFYIVFLSVPCPRADLSKMKKRGTVVFNTIANPDKYKHSPRFTDTIKRKELIV